VNKELAEPAATMTALGTVTSAEPDETLTATADWTTAESDTVQVETAPGESAAGEQLRAETPSGGVNLSEKVRVAPFRPAPSVVEVSPAMAAAPAVNVAVSDPALTVMVEGTVTEGWVLDSVTDRPPAGAAAVSVTVQALVPGVAITAGSQVRLAGWISGDTVMTAARMDPPEEAAIVVVTAPDTAPASAVKVEVAAPAAMVLVAGTLTAA
jgi:hypothetical protein